MKIFDSHAHLTDECYSDDLSEIITNFPGKIMMPSCTLADAHNTVMLANRHDKLYSACGIHPHYAYLAPKDYISELEKLIVANPKKVCAIGEAGLDYHYDDSPREAQKLVFEEQLKLAQDLDMPIILHMRDATQDMLHILSKYKVKGVMHCFSGSAETAKICLSMGLYISFSGSVTFKNAPKVQHAAGIVPLNKLMAETDSPYLSPPPYRGKRNQPCYTQYIIEKLAEIKGISSDDATKITYTNACDLFGIEE